MPSPESGTAVDIGPRSTVRDRLRQAIAGSELPNYVYSYPSKRAYRAVDPPMTVAEVWRDAPTQLNLYLHIPFCAYRCAFCTLFLTTSQTPGLVERYLDSLHRQIAMYGGLLGDREVVSIYVGGGTPTTLTETQIEQLFSTIRRAFPNVAPGAEIGVEGSPDSVTAAKVESLRAAGVNRMSVGLQTLDPAELQRVGRPYTIDTVHDAVAAIAAGGFTNVNYDLIYGLEGQHRDTWLRSLHGTIDFGPTTLTLYPVVFRPLTVIERRRSHDAGRFLANDDKYALYDESVEILAGRGYRQDSFVRFTTLGRDGYQQEAADFSGVPLLGLGTGARSYASGVHYGTDFAVGRKSTNDIIAGFVDHHHRPDEPLTIGFVLSGEEQRRRFCILTLSLGVLDRGAYRARFPGHDLDEFTDELDALEAEGCVESDSPSFRLTRKGFKYSNVIGTLFRSAAVAELERSYVAN